MGRVVRMEKAREQCAEDVEARREGKSSGRVLGKHHGQRSCKHYTAVGESQGLTQRSRRRMRPSQLAVLATVAPAFAYICLYVFGASRESMEGNAISKKATRAGNVLGVDLDGFHARRQALVDGVIRTSIGVGEPVGFVFEGDSKDTGEKVSAGEQFAAAGAPVIVLDDLKDVQAAIRRYIDEDGGSPFDFTRNIHSQVSGLVFETMKSASASASASDTNGWDYRGMPPGFPTVGAGVDGRKICCPSSATAEEAPAAIPQESGANTGKRSGGGGDAEWNDEDAIRESSRREIFAKEQRKSTSSDYADRGGSERRDEAGLASSRRAIDASTRSGDTGFEREVSIPSGARAPETKGQRMSASSSLEILASSRDAEKGGGGSPERGDHLSGRRPQQQQQRHRSSAGNGGTSDDSAEPWAIILAVSGWRRDEMEALLQAFPRTPWLYLVHRQPDEGGDGSDISCQQNLWADTAVGLMSDPNNVSNGVVLTSTRLTAGAAARVLRRHFGVKLHPWGELLMTQVDAKKAIPNQKELSYTRARYAATVAVGDGDAAAEATAGTAAAARAAAAAAGCPSFDQRACCSAREGGLEAVEESAKVLGGPFDTVWWWGSGDNITHTRVVGRRQQQQVSEEGPTQGLHAREMMESGGIFHGRRGGTPACKAYLIEDPPVAPSVAAPGESRTGRLSPEDVRLHGACAGGGDGCGREHIHGSRWAEAEARERKESVHQTPRSSSSSSPSAVIPEADEAARHHAQSRGLLADVSAARLASGGKQEDEGENEIEERERWEKGLRRMVDGDAPSWMSSEVYSEPVERFSCPDVPDPDYPAEWPLLDLLANWNPGNASSGVPERHFLGVCRFDYQTELHKARAYSLSEVPFIVYNIPDLDKAVQEWSNPAKLAAALKGSRYSVDVSSSNRFLYYGKRSNDRPPGWTPPTSRVMRTFDWWLQHALRVPFIDNPDEIRPESDGIIDERYEGNDGRRKNDHQNLNDDVDESSLSRDLLSLNTDRSTAKSGEDLRHQPSDGVPDHKRLSRPPDQCPDQHEDEYFDVSLEQSLDTYLEQPPEQRLERSLDQFSGRSGGDEGGTQDVKDSAVEQDDGERNQLGEEEVVQDSGNTHYYFKLSSFPEKPNHFVERSLPFFVPSPSSDHFDGDYFDDIFGTSPADEGDYATDTRGRRRKGPRRRRWAGNEGRRRYRGELQRGGAVRSGADNEARWGSGVSASEKGEDAGGVGGELLWLGVSGKDREGEREGREHEEEERGREEQDAGVDILDGRDDPDTFNIFMKDPSATKGIHCRLGMDGVMSDGHYDGSRNMVALLAGKRRWILSKPQNCSKMHMFRKGHPSARHTSADWTDPDVASHFPDLREATANEVILRAGEALYVPEHWIHSIVNIGVSAQCNSRSGKSFLYQPIIRECEEQAQGE
ncbi:unnamed protein product [Scytosiphon promiscuus]